MSFRVYEETLNEAQEEALAMLKSTRSASVTSARFDWLYRQNPDGPAVLWSIRNGETGEMAGFTVGLPRRIVVDGKVQRCWNGADFSIHPKFRTLGIALKLRRAAKEAVDAGRVDFLYAHPNSQMQLIHERVGHQPVGTMMRFTKLLRTERYLKRSPLTRWLPNIASGFADSILRFTGREWRHRASVSTSFVAGIQFDKRFDGLFEEAASIRPVVGVRDAQYLNWRYSQNPLYKTDAILAEQGTRLVGYAVFAVDGNVVHLKDLFAVGDKAVLRDLTAALIQHCRTLWVDCISAVALDGNPILPVLKEFGFMHRLEGSEMFGYVSNNSPLASRVLKRDHWFLTVGDRDV